MFCSSCGEEVPAGNRFCSNCGSSLQAGAAVQQPPAEHRRDKRKGGFFYSPAGIALVAIIGLAVLAGITLGIIFLVRSGSDDTVDAATMDVWEEYQDILENDGADLAQISMDPNALVNNQEDLKKAQERVAALEKVLAKTGGSETWRGNPDIKTVGTRDIKAAQMAAALSAYNRYVQKMNEFFGALIGAINGNQLINPDVINNLNAILAEVQKLGEEVTTLSGDFIRGNDKVLVSVKDFDPPILTVSKGITTQMGQKVAEAQAAEAARVAAEQVAAQQAAAAAEEERQRQAAAAEKEAGQVTMVRVPRVANPCGNPDCNECYMWMPSDSI